MPSITEIVDAKLKNLHEVPDALIDVVNTQQKKLLREISDALDTLELDGSGNIVVNQKNIGKVEGIVVKMQEVFFDKDYIEAVSAFAEGIDSQAALTRSLIKAGIGPIDANKLYSQVLTATRKNAVSLFGESYLEGVYFEPLRQQLLVNITTGASFKEAVKAIQLITVGDATTDGVLHTYARTYARTSYAQADATYTTTISRSMGVEWYKYAGSVIESSREFCDTRHNKYYHVKEVESWGQLGNWDGKIKGTNSSSIFANRGGWNCRHSLVPYSVSRIPKDDIRRAIRKGYFTPTDAERKELGL